MRLEAYVYGVALLIAGWVTGHGAEDFRSLPLVMAFYTLGVVWREYER